MNISALFVNEKQVELLWDTILHASHWQNIWHNTQLSRLWGVHLSPIIGENLSLGARDLVHTQQNQACIFDLVTLLKDTILIYETTIHLAEGYRLKLF